MPFVQTGDVSGAEGVIRSYSQTLSEEGLSISKVFPKGTLLMTIAANIGDVAELGFESACPDSLVAISPREQVCRGFLRRFLETQKPHIHYLAPQNAQKNINVDFLEVLPVALPSYDEQRAISGIFDLWDEAAEKASALLVAKQDLKRGLMQRLLSGRVRFKEFREEQWRKVQLNDVLVCEPRVTRKPASAFLAAGVRSHGKGVFLKPDFEAEDIALDELFQLQTDDLVVNITFAWEGAVAIVPPEADGALVSHRFPTFTFRSGVSSADYFRHVIRQKHFVHELGLVSPGGAGRNRVLSKQDFLRISLELPSFEEQGRIAKVLSACDQEIELLQKELEALREQKRGLMQKLLTGEVRVKV
jgi:type I restriction enzyme S subunit